MNPAGIDEMGEYLSVGRCRACANLVAAGWLLACPAEPGGARPALSEAEVASGAAGEPVDAVGEPEAFDREAAFAEGLRLLESGQTEAGVQLLTRVERAGPSAAVYWNLGLGHSELGQHREALAAWGRYLGEQPDDWRARAKLIQSYQALGDIAARDRALTELRALRDTSGNASLSATKRFCREQFTEAGKEVIVHEYFEPEPPRRVSLRFSVLDDSGREAYYIALGSLVSTEAYSREAGEIPPDGRLYNVDRYEGSSHQLYVFATSEPSYEMVRALVVDILNDRVRPVSGMSKKTAASD